ncbi:MAG: hypothetical protein ACFFD4_39520 [Candidatus Odinarchaeota archaeon]
MLIRIVPEMFSDNRFECVTIPEVRKEIFQTQKFKSKYPWRTEFKAKIKALGMQSARTEKYALYLEAIKNLIESGTINQKTRKSFNLSRVDQTVAAYALANEYEITTGDKDLIDFLKQEFSKENISPLGLVNRWLRKGLIKWNSYCQTIIEDWDKSNENSQPRKEIKKFERLTDYKYVGS